MVKKRLVEINIDESEDVAYLSLTSEKNVQVKDTYICESLSENVKGDINLDFDSNGRLVGIELIGVSTLLAEDL